MELKIRVPDKYMNIAITTSGYLVADSNDSKDWHQYKRTLPSGLWVIYSIKNNLVTIRTKDN